MILLLANSSVNGLALMLGNGGVSTSCRSLDARIEQSTNIYEMDFVEIQFILKNLGVDCFDVFPGSWEIVINGKKMPDSGFILGNGPGPIGGYKALNSGQSFEFGKGIALTKEHFPMRGDYKMYWRGKHFRSNTITIVP
jgi:hypothetical protein